MEQSVSTPQLTVVSGLMGGGKSGVNSAILEGLQSADLATWGRHRVMSVSETSRARRVGLGEAEDAYKFGQLPERFEDALQTGEIMERAYHSGVHYGSPTPAPNQPTHLEIEVTGVAQIMKSEHPRVVVARQGIRAVYLLQSSMGDLCNQIMGRDDGMSKEKKLERISRYPSEILYIIRNDLPYQFITNVAGFPEIAQANAVAYMLADPRARTVPPRIAHNLAAGATSWLKYGGLAPAEIQ